MERGLIQAARVVGESGMSLLGALPPLSGILCLSLLSALLFLLAARFLCPRRRLRRIKELISASIYELRLFAASPRRVLLAQGRMVRFIVEYLLCSLPPLAALLPLMAPLLTSASLRWEYRPPRVGEIVLVTISLEPGSPLHALHLEAADRALTLLPPIIHVPHRHQIVARLSASRPGTHELRVRLGGHEEKKRVEFGGKGPVSLNRSRAADGSLLLSREPPLADREIQRIEVEHPSRELRWLGISWPVLYALAVIVFVIAFRRRFGVVL
jgi:hypothetical protein